MNARRRWWERLVWILDHDDVVEFCAPGIGRRQALDRWLAANGLPDGSKLEGGTVGCVQSLWGGLWLVARTYPPGDRGWGWAVRGRFVEEPPTGLIRTAVPREESRQEWPPPDQ